MEEKYVEIYREDKGWKLFWFFGILTIGLCLYESYFLETSIIILQLWGIWGAISIILTLFGK